MIATIIVVVVVVLILVVHVEVHTVAAIVVTVLEILVVLVLLVSTDPHPREGRSTGSESIATRRRYNFKPGTTPSLNNPHYVRFSIIFSRNSSIQRTTHSPTHKIHLMP